MPVIQDPILEKKVIEMLRTKREADYSSDEPISRPRTPFFSAAWVFGLVYKYGIKKIFFRFDPEDVHERMTSVGVWLGRWRLARILIRWMFDYTHPSLEQTVAGIHFKNPIGLSAGFDKNAVLTDILPAIGFGFAEVGSITGEPCKGNPKPRLWRLPASRSIVVHFGLNNDGCEAISKRLEEKRFTFPVGTSIAKTNSPETIEMEAGIRDYAKAYTAFASIGDYTTVNISCPNASGGCPFVDGVYLEALLTRLDAVPTSKPVFLKLPPDLSETQLDTIIDVSEHHRVDGFVCTNLSKRRDRDFLKKYVKEKDIPAVGGLSGKVVDELSDEMIRRVYRKTRGTKIIIASGGVFSAQDAYRKIRLGASLVQLITGMIFEGPQVIGQINRRLAILLARDGFKSVAEAVGMDDEKGVK